MKKGSVVFGVVIGAVAGVVAGVLTAPKSGKETRDDIKHKGDELKDQAAKTRDELIFKAEEIGEDVKATVSKAIESVVSSKEKK